MVSITRYVAALSGKGGVGKTTTVLNLGLALQGLEKDTVVVDTNLITPNMSLQLGLTPSEATMNDVLYKKAGIDEAVHVHSSGLHVVPAGLSALEYKNHFQTDYKTALKPLEKEYEYVLMDCSAGLWGEVSQAVKAADESLIVTNPELPSMVDSLKAIKMSEKLGVDVTGVVLNKVRGKHFELQPDTIEGMLKEHEIVGKIPYDKQVPRSSSKRTPISDYKPNSKASKAFKRLAKSIDTGEKVEPGFFERILPF